jgi:NADPH:quinone reductase-like Zn-dependent oxidoreductase
MTLVIAQYGKGGPEVMRTEDREVPPPPAAQVRIAQEAIGFNFFDALQRRGLISQDDPGRVMGIGEAKREAARRNGATDVAVGLGDVIDQVARLTGGQGVDVIFDGIGADAADRLLDSGTVRTGGTIISFGAGAGFPSADPQAIARRGATVLVPQVPNYIETPDALRAGMAEVFALYRTGAFGKISPTIYPLSEAASLHDQVERRVVSGISVLVPPTSAPSSTTATGQDEHEDRHRR